MTTFVPRMALGRVRTALNTVLRRSKMQRAREEAWQRYDTLQERLTLTLKQNRSNRLARFADNILNANLPRPVRYLEIGSFEGASLAFVYSLLDGNVRIAAIDQFADYSELPGKSLSVVEKTFDANVRTMGATDAVRKLKGRSLDHLSKLIDAGETFDLIYIDGSHHALDVMVDAVLAWRLLAPSGLMIFDDYRFREQHDGEVYQPRVAIDAFIGMMRDKLAVVDVAGQVFVRRKG
jgi:predicted O-methyltransferase YrrM